MEMFMLLNKSYGSVRSLGNVGDKFDVKLLVHNISWETLKYKSTLITDDAYEGEDGGGLATNYDFTFTNEMKVKTVTVGAKFYFRNHGIVDASKYNEELLKYLKKWLFRRICRFTGWW